MTRGSRRAPVRAARVRVGAAVVLMGLIGGCAPGGVLAGGAPVTVTPIVAGVPTAPAAGGPGAGGGPCATPGPTPSVAACSTPAGGGDARAALDRLPVKGPAPLTGYSRDRFGPAWADVDHTGCDQRNQVLARDLTGETLRPGSKCVVSRGRLAEPYTGRTIDFVRGPRTSSLVQIDHLVALGDAWRTGAQQLDQHTREMLAGDPLELLAVDGPANESKGDRDAAAWLPPNKSFRCAYVARQVAVKTRYHLWVIPAERDAIIRVLDRCPGQRLPTA